MDEAEYARAWLAEEGVVERGPGVWFEPPDRVMTPGEVAHDWAHAAMSGYEEDPREALRVAFGLLDLLDEWWVAAEMASVIGRHQDDRVFWEGYRRRLDSPAEPKTITYSLWAEWFEDAATVGRAFAEVLGDDAGDLAAIPNRARWVLEASGPVPWPLKHPVYRAAAELPALHMPLFKAIRAGYHDVYGDLEPGPALDLLDGLSIPADTEHLAPLRTALAAGHRNHRHSPEAWRAAAR
ncbi:hypothetical protein [Actinomadura hibisca]|uniref:hypothetical protein n=1 Tax=Actinomadura hibisca TaxID=68565 RepID=UPI00082DFE8B|nr:hypothetical protein [Actinomadura hibisca]